MVSSGKYSIRVSSFLWRVDWWVLFWGGWGGAGEVSLSHTHTLHLIPLQIISMHLISLDLNYHCLHLDRKEDKKLVNREQVGGARVGLE